jgi:transcriptional regulator GlxA family with amidase domain
VLIAEVAAACGVSSRTLEHAFRDAVGLTPMQVLTSFRLDEARSMLLDRETDASVTDIAMACGFRHLGRFSRVYGHRFGELPSETRARR